jgi:catechol 2,3-dioxygenase-like lactoylglutathione lyase family enzyme
MGFEKMIKLKHLDHITITSRDPEKSIAFYSDVLGMTPAYEWPGEITMLQSGDTFIAIAWWAKGKPIGDQPPITVDHFAFRVDLKTYDFARKEFADKGVKVDHESDHGNCHSIYVRDPDNHLVELVCYEKIGANSKKPKHL